MALKDLLPDYEKCTCGHSDITITNTWDQTIKRERIEGKMQIVRIIPGKTVTMKLTCEFCGKEIDTIEENY